jgi:heat shock protein HslJ
MISNKWLFSVLLSVGFLYASDTVSLSKLEGSWLLRTMDGYKVSQARAILDFNAKHNKIDGFDGCNRISGKLKLHQNKRYFSKLSIQEYECRGNLQRYVSKRLHQTMEEGFTIQRAKRKKEKGILVKSANHTLFFKKMGRPFSKTIMP